MSNVVSQFNPDLINKNLISLRSKKYSTSEFFDDSGNFDPTLDSGVKNERIKIKIPEECRGFNVPEDINAYIEKIYANLEYFVVSKLYSVHFDQKMIVTHDIIANYVMYLLGETTKKDKGMKRYQRYGLDSYRSRFPNIPFYRWMMNDLNFFIKTFKTAYVNNAKGKRGKSELTFVSLDKTLDGYSQSNSLADASIRCDDLSLTEEKVGSSILLKKVEDSFRKLVKTSCTTHLEAEMMQTVYDELHEGSTVLKIMESLNLSRDTVVSYINRIRSGICSQVPNLRSELRMLACA